MNNKNHLAAEIHQSKPFSSLEEEVSLSLLRTTDAWNAQTAVLFKNHGLSATQYNVLRILRGAGETGLRCNEIGERMITRDSDITRLLDRMERAELIARERDTRDRRAVITRISAKGLALLATLDEPVARLNRQLLAHLSQEQLLGALALLDRMRQPWRQAR
jgi:DNA-binding MarR family transcriptional regulator